MDQHLVNMYARVNNRFNDGFWSCFSRDSCCSCHSSCFLQMRHIRNLLFC